MGLYERHWERGWDSPQQGFSYEAAFPLAIPIEVGHPRCPAKQTSPCASPALYQLKCRKRCRVVRHRIALFISLR
ncbi:hypothetical protein RHIZ404_200983 [Rhizobium sp. EC-SD404]|nr:hypothetical protein RHIZ404_200983 [Rhizobium sp. EC-SD404]